MFKLYKSEKYGVLIGTNKNVGLCTAWNEPKRVFTDVEKYVGLTGTLYSKFGVNIVIRNLALNPQITTLYLWANGNLSNTEVGKMGHEALKTLWKDPNTKEVEIQKEINRETLNKIVQNVKLVDVSDKSKDELKEVLVKTKTQTRPYMEPTKFKEPKMPEFITLPSEKVGWVVRGQKIADTWARVVDRIMRYGTIMGTQYGSRQKQLIGLNWVIESEDPNNVDFSFIDNLPKNLKKTIVADTHSLEQYSKEVFEKSEKDENLTYTYGNRLQNYPISNGLLDQVQKTLIGNLKESLNSRRAAATTIIPEQDYNNTEPPCLSLVQCLVDDHKLHMLVTFRSHDIFKAGISNSYGLLKTQQKICKALDIEQGSLQINSQSAHIYEQDWKDAQNMCKCFYWESEPEMFFDHNTMADKRGNFLVNVVNNQIEVILQNEQGENVVKVEGKNAKYISLKLSKMDVIGRVDHAMDIARQLQKAETAIQNNLEFNQDQPLKI
jgi:thymidylate synthase